MMTSWGCARGWLRRVSVMLVPGLILGPAGLMAAERPPAQPARAATDTALSPLPPEAIDQLVAPIALYPDALLSQILMASTYPSEVALAAKWSKANPKQQGDGAVRKVGAEPWDPSVKALVAFPSVVQTMGKQPEWTQKLGDAFLGQPEAVLDSVQRLRKRAEEAGTLKDTPQQRVETETQQGATVIEIVQADPEIVYVPTYDPMTAYGAWPYAAYPPWYLPTPVGYGFASGVATGLAWGAGVALTGALWGGVDWFNNDIDIDVNRYNSVNRDRLEARGDRARWQHDGAHRRGVPYRDARSRGTYDRSLPGAQNRQAYRGREGQRQQARSTLQQRTGATGLSAADRQPVSGGARRGQTARQPGQTGAFGQGASRDFRSASSPRRDSAFSDVGAGRRSSVHSARGTRSMGGGFSGGARMGGFRGGRR